MTDHKNSTPLDRHAPMRCEVRRETTRVCARSRKKAISEQDWERARETKAPNATWNMIRQRNGVCYARFPREGKKRSALQRRTQGPGKSNCWTHADNREKAPRAPLTWRSYSCIHPDHEKTANTETPRQRQVEEEIWEAWTKRPFAVMCDLSPSSVGTDQPANRVPNLQPWHFTRFGKAGILCDAPAVEKRCSDLLRIMQWSTAVILGTNRSRRQSLDRNSRKEGIAGGSIIHVYFTFGMAWDAGMHMRKRKVARPDSRENSKAEVPRAPS